MNRDKTKETIFSFKKKKKILAREAQPDIQMSKASNVCGPAEAQPHDQTSKPNRILEEEEEEEGVLGGYYY